MQNFLDLLPMQSNELSQFADELKESMGDLSVIFPQNPPKLHLSIIVQVSPTPGELVMRSVGRDLLTPL